MYDRVGIDGELFMLNKRFGFTLAEVLITLGIVGIVAAMTVPTLINNYKEKVRVNKLKKSYAVLTSAFNLAKNEFGEVAQWGLPASSDTQNYTIAIGDKLRTFMKVDRICSTRNEFQKCFTGGYRGTKEFRNGFLDGTGHAGASYHSFVSNGITYGISSYYNDLSNVKGINKVYYAGITVYIEPYLHVNAGYTYGKNVFQFLLTDKGILPAGDGDNLPEVWYKYVSLPFKVYCVQPSGKFGRGQGCTDWVIKKENMDYLKCPEKIAAGASGCK